MKNEETGATGGPAQAGDYYQIDIWAVGFVGYGWKTVAQQHPNWNLIPAGLEWQSPELLTGFLKLLAGGGYTHVWFLLNADAVCHAEFPVRLIQICRMNKIKIHSTLYYPVDAPIPQHAPDQKMLRAVDVAVTFTEYGRRETEKHVMRGPDRHWINPIRVLPHGLEEHFTPMTVAERLKYRGQFQVADGKTGKQRSFLKPGDFLLLNVNKNEHRKDLLRSLEILKGLRDRGVPAKLVIRANPTSTTGGIHLQRAAEQLGLTLDQEWAHIGPVPEEHMRGLYAAADLYLTTSLGEGWGLGVTEALSCGTPVAMPGHTSLWEIGFAVENAKTECQGPPVVWLPMEEGYVCGADTRLRQRVVLEPSCQIIHEYYQQWVQGQAYEHRPRVGLSAEVKEWLSWKRVATEFLKLMGIL